MRFQKSYDQGKRAEDRFLQACKENNIETQTSSKNDNIHKHIDIMVRVGGYWYSCDIKAQKKLDRNSDTYLSDEIWIELKNVRGNKGWLYGEVEYIVFEFPSEFIFVNRKKLLTFVEERVDFSVTYGSKQLYKLYSREKYGREDLLTLVSKKDLMAHLGNVFKLKK